MTRAAPSLRTPRRWRARPVPERRATRSPVSSDRSGCDERGHALTRRGVRQLADARLHVVDDVLGTARPGNHARDGGVSEDPLQEELGPALAVELGRPRRQRLATNALEQPALGEGAVHEYGDAALAGQGQDAALGLALAERVVDLDEVHR